MNKIKHYFSTFELISGFFIAVLGAGFIYLQHFGLSFTLLNTLLALLSLYYLIQANQRTWFWYGLFMGVLWFWWIALSLQHYGYAWALPVGIILVSLLYGFIFWFIAWLANKISLLAPESFSSLLRLTLLSLSILSFSYIHPLKFDWHKPELMFVESYIGIDKWQFGLVLLAITLSLWKKNLWFLLLLLLAYSPTKVAPPPSDEGIALISTAIEVENKWNTDLHKAHFKILFAHIDKAIEEKKKLIILPESVFPLFLNHDQALIDKLQERAKHINIVTGALYHDGKTPKNTAYIFQKDKITVANKVLLVPFGESNPLPDFLAKWVNDVFYDGAIDYQASPNIVNYQIDNITYRNAICFEATSEKLYKGLPKQMIVISNNGWFVPSIEPTLQTLLLQYYSKKYGTTIYHSVNMSPSYVIRAGKVEPAL